MIANCRRYIVLAFSIFAAVLVIITSCLGLFIPGIYVNETANWQAQAIGQDIVDLFVVAPALIVYSLLAHYGDKKAIMLRAGIFLYIIYTYTIYCYDIHFNQLFLIYCLILGSSVYQFLWFILSQFREPVDKWFDEVLPVKIVGIYLIVIAALFYLLWFSQIIPANLHSSVPNNLKEAGLLTNPVHVLDISIFLPAILITGILLLGKNPMGLLMTPPILFFCLLMEISVGVVVVVLKIRGMDANWMVLIGMCELALFSGVLLVIYLRSFRLKT